MEQRNGLGRSIILWLLPGSVVALGIACAFFALMMFSKLLTGNGQVFLFYLICTAAGVFLMKRSPVLSKLCLLKKIRLRDHIITSMFTFGTIGTTILLFANKTFAEKETHLVDARITNKMLFRPRGMYEDEYEVSFSVIGMDMSEDFSVGMQPIVDTARCVHITYKTGLLGYRIMTDCKL